MSKGGKFNYLHWYTDEQISRLIELQVEQSVHQENISILDPILFDIGTGHIQGSLRKAIQEDVSLNGKTAILPINLNENHWVSMVIGKNNQGDLIAVYNNPLGTPLKEEKDAAVIKEILVDESGVKIMDLSRKQQINGNDCGPFTVDNAVKIALSFQRNNSTISRRHTTRNTEQELLKTVFEENGLLRDVGEENIQGQKLREDHEGLLPGLHNIISDVLPEPRKRSRTKGTRADIIHENGHIKVQNWGRPSGVLPGGGHGDHDTAWISSIHGTRRIINNLEIGETESLDQLRPARGDIYDNLSAIAILDGDWDEYQEEGSSVKTTKYKVKLHKSEENQKGEPYLYARINDLLDEYNEKRQELTKLDIIEKLLNAVHNLEAKDQEAFLGLIPLSNEQKKLIQGNGGIAAIAKENIDKSKRSNADLICQTFMDMIYETSIHYYTIPGTTYRKIPGYEAPDSEGSQVRTALARLDKVFDAYKEQNSIDSAQIGTTVQQKISLSDIAKTVLCSELGERKGKLKPVTTSEDKKKQKEIEIQIDRLERYQEEPLGYIAVKLKDVFYYPEVPNDKLKHDGEKKDRFDRNNDIKELYNKAAKHLFTYSNIYPEIDFTSTEDDKLLELFLKEVITSKVAEKGKDDYQKGERGWPSLREEGSDNIPNLSDHKQEVLNRINDLNHAKNEYLYTKTPGHRKRLSSTSVELVKASIIAQTINVVKEDLTQDEERLKRLEDNLSKLSLKKGEEDEFREDVLENVQVFFKQDRIEEDKFKKLESFLGPEKEKGGRS